MKISFAVEVATEVCVLALGVEEGDVAMRAEVGAEDVRGDNAAEVD